MKLIDILNLRAKGELEEETEMRVGSIVFFYRNGILENGKGYPLFTSSYLSKSALLQEVEIISKDTTVATKKTDCENWKEADADFMFKALGYEKWEYEYEIGYRGKKDIVFNKPRKDIIVGDLDDYYQPAAAFTMAELKAINKKCQELGWE